MVRVVDVSSTLGEHLTAEQRETFTRNGFLHFRPFLDPGAVKTILRAVDELGQRWTANGVRLVNGTPIKYGRDMDGGPFVQRYAFASQHHEVLAALMSDPRFNALLSLVGPGARLGTHEKDGLVINHYVNTPSSNFTQMGWHTDALRDLFLGRRIGPMLNVGIHLDDQDPRNGGLRLLPGTHAQNLRSMLFRKRYFMDTQPDPDEVAFDIRAGDLTVHDGRLWHRVQRSRLVGEASRRRVMYIPVVSGAYQPKSDKSRTPIYHRLQHLVK